MDSKLIQVQFDDIRPIDAPMDVPYTAQKAMLRDWNGDLRQPEWVKLVAAIRRRASGEIACNRPDEVVTLGSLMIAASAGDAKAQHDLAKMHLLQQNAREAARLFRLSAAQEYPAAQFELGLMFMNGATGVRRSSEKSVELFTSAGVQGHAGAQYELGLWNTSPVNLGWGGSLDEAEKWFLLAASQKFPGARLALSQVKRLKG
jgi:Sel1 repeat